MEKIIFEDLPSTKTPLNAENLNQIQTNAENAINDLNENLEDKITEINDKFNFSTKEQVIGIWLGKPMYRKTIIFDAINIEASTQIWSQQLSLENIDSIFLDMNHSYWINTDNGGQFPIPYVNHTASTYLGHFISINNGVPTFNIRKTQNISVWSIEITVEYTKINE